MGLSAVDDIVSQHKLSLSVIVDNKGNPLRKNPIYESRRYIEIEEEDSPPKKMMDRMDIKNEQVELVGRTRPQYFIDGENRRWKRESEELSTYEDRRSGFNLIKLVYARVS